MKINRRKFMSGAAASTAAVLTSRAAAQQRIIMNDASRLNPTPVFNHWVVKPQPDADLIAALRKEFAEAAAQRRPVCVGAARHSMGGQSLPRNGVAISLEINRCEPDHQTMTYKVHGGTRWFQVIRHLDRAGLSPAVMQSNADFGVAATFSVNAHGWPTPYGPFGSTVRSLRIMLADGSIVTCSRTENAELFSLVMGGYGLFGIILDLEVDMVENALLRPTAEVMPSSRLAHRFMTLANDPAVLMIYGRMKVARDDLFAEGKIVSYRVEPTPAAGLPPATRSGPFPYLSRQIYRAQIGAEAAKRARWALERRTTGVVATRNSLMNEPASNLAGRDPRRTDTLHEYFLPPERFDDFIAGCQKIIPKAKAEFLNVTLRHVVKDDSSVLSFAQTSRIAAVMSFSQEISSAGEADMILLTEGLIDLARSCDGSFYLPYRLHARRDQLEAMYPNLPRFIERKRHYDPGLVFRNAMWDTYFAG